MVRRSFCNDSYSPWHSTCFGDRAEEANYVSYMKRISLGIAITMVLGACGSDSQDALEGVSSVVFLQRPARRDVGDIFQYASYVPGARLMELSPPAADGELRVLCCDRAGPDFAAVDISSYDIAFDAREIVFSAKLSADQAYGLFLLSLETGDVAQLPTDPNRDYIMPIFMPGDRIMFMSNAVVEEGAPQFHDEYERGVTTQMGLINRDGSGETLGARNLSHRVYPTMLSDGRVLFTQWDHLGDQNAGHLLIANPDMTTVREAFGKERTGVANSYLKAVEIAPGRVIAIGSARDRTLQSGALLDIRLGETYAVDGKVHADRNMSEANASVEILTAGVPLDREPSSASIGRYYDAYPLNAVAKPDLLVSWADGPVESGTLAAAGLNADFGIYLYQSSRFARRPIYNDPDYWDVLPRPLVARDAPPVIEPSGGHGFGGNSVLLGAMNVYESSRFTFEPGSIYGVRIREGFSGEEGVGRDFGLTEHEGAAVLGIAPVQEDGSWAALIPANIPVSQQVIDKFGMALASEPIWISGAPGESRFCGGCHESRSGTTVISPGITEAVAVGPSDLGSALSRTDRVSTSYTIDSTIGVPWNEALQPIFDAKCISCHNGQPGPANPSYTATDPATGASMTWTFDLRGQEADYGVGEMMLSGYSASHLSLMGPDMMMLEDLGLVIEGEITRYVDPTRARDSILIQKLNPPQLFPSVSTSVRAFDGPTHGELYDFTLTPDEYYLLILMADNGGQFYSRENAPGLTY